MAEYDINYWKNQITASKTWLLNFHESGKTVVQKYLDSQEKQANTEDQDRKYNMFWANIGILKSALYGNPPQPTANREFQDPDDDVGRVAATIMERLLKTGAQGHNADMHAAFTHSVEDRLVPGLGQVWLRYEARVGQVPMPGTPTMQIPQIADENVLCDYVFWGDFFYEPVRVWEEVTWLARRVWMTKEKAKARFPEHGDNLPMKIPTDGVAYDAPKSGGNTEFQQRAEIFEIWCKTTRKIHWICPGYDHMLDEKDDPLNLPNFWPCPRPLTATTSTSKFIPKSDYSMVQDQYKQLDELNVRIGYLVAACKVVGLYDKTAEGAQRLLSQAVENQLIPVDNWAMFAEKGGIKGIVDWLPIEQVVAVIDKLREYRVDCVQQIYELTGISDIMRGVSSDRETFGAQKLKAQYSSARLQLYQLAVGAFVAEVMHIKALIISKHWQRATILKKSLIMSTADAQYAEQAVELIKNSFELMYRINVSSTQMSIPDYNAEKESRTEFITAMGQFLSQSVQFVQLTPSAGPFLLKMLQWAGASFQATGEVETLFDNYIREVEKSLTTPPPPPPPDPVAQAQAAKLTADAGLSQAKTVTEQSKPQREMAELQIDAQAAMGENQAQLAQTEAEGQRELARIAAESAVADKKVEGDLSIALFKARAAIEAADRKADATIRQNEQKTMGAMLVNMGKRDAKT